MKLHRCQVSAATVHGSWLFGVGAGIVGSLARRDGCAPNYFCRQNCRPVHRGGQETEGWPRSPHGLEQHSVVNISFL